MNVDPVDATLSPDALSDLRARLRAARLPPFVRSGPPLPGQPPLPEPGWEHGVPAPWLAQLVRDWLEFDQPVFQTELDALPHFQSVVSGQRIHLVHIHGRGPDPMPLLLTHGWPGSFLEYRSLIPLLTDPAAHGGDATDAFSVVVPSLPGFGFSAPPPASGLTATAVADLWRQLMVDGLGYPRYVAHGSDLGAGVTIALARADPDHVAGIHLATPTLLPAAPLPHTPAESAYFDDAARWSSAEGGYAHEHSTKPATLSAALADSPVGLAAWIGEKSDAWSPVRADGRSAFERDLLLATLTLYWATDTIASSLLPYWAGRHTPVLNIADAAPVRVPTSVSIFGGERVPFPKPPRELAERYFALTAWREYDRGGHFPAVAEPELLAGILRETFRPLR